MLDQRGAAFDPVAVVAIQHAAEIADLGVMDMAADDAVEAAAARLIGQRIGKRANILHGVLDPELQVGRQRPILVAEHPAPQVEVAVDPQRSV